MGSSLTFDATKIFRDKLIARNLKPYRVEGNFTPPSAPTTYEIVQRDIEVVDSPDELISDNPFVDVLYTKNTYGPIGGFDKDLNVNNTIITDKPNQGEYNYADTKLDRGSQNNEAKKNLDVNLYLNPQILQGGVMSALYNIPANPAVPRSEFTKQRSQTYPNFNLSNTYTPYNILLGTDQGLLSQDSALQQIGAKSLQKNLEDRVAREIEQRTINRINIIPALQDPVTAVQVVSGRIPAIEGDYTITRASNPVVAAADLGLRLNGAYIPTSVIPGQYFTDDQRFPSPVGQITNAFNATIKSLGGVIGLNLKSLGTDPSQIFINNTGSWTRNRILNTLSFNRYKPFYSLGIAGDVIQSIGNAIGNAFNINTTGGYYVGSDSRDPSRITSPVNEIPVNEFGVPDESIVYGPEKLAQDFEEQSFNFGLAGKSSTDADGAIEGGFVWTSPKYKGNAGFRVKPGGDIGSQDFEFPQISAKFEQNSSSEKNFRNGTILDKTQRIVDSQPEGKKRLSHAGNAIDQVSKVFHDGYKEITKGSKVKSFINAQGESIIKDKKIVTPNEYCRLFTKDTPYYTYNDLQKSQGLVRSKQGLTTFSILDNVYNLNIAPTTNANGKATEATSQKKYMLSIENLAWRTSSRQGYRVSDLPECEKGPNGGRIMWFPPYNLSFSESVTPSWQGTTFLGRPEPVYTYKDTNRTGQLSFSIVVDHPSILNLIVNKYLDKEDPDKVNEIVDSFFAGCLKYDLYELALKYNTIPLNELVYFQEILGDPVVKKETVNEVVTTITTKTNTKVTPTPKLDFTEFETSLYFDNAIPGPGSTASYTSLYNTYLGKKSNYIGSAGTFFDTSIVGSFDKIDKGGGLKKKIYDALSQNPKQTIKIKLTGRASSPDINSNNKSLGARRNDAVEKYLLEPITGTEGLSKFLGKQLTIEKDSQGEDSTIDPASYPEGGAYKQYLTNGPINCFDNLPVSQRIISIPAAACRSVGIKIEAPKADDVVTTEEETITNTDTVPRIKRSSFRPKIRTEDKRGLTKRVIRFLLSECDYFKYIQAETPFIYNSMKEKIKYFNPTFHSTTPEGLNARLTFLQQCTRPGDTIPTIGVDGTLTNNDAYNTAFGAPPVLVLRVGDFFNTKVLCNNLSIQYEPLHLDMNPEGIGVQPMIAKVSLGITFIGGSGLKQPIEQLQNALSFNYYANTEIYDDRAEATEDTLAFDEQFYDRIKEIQDAQKAEQADNQQVTNEGGDAIGKLTASPTSVTAGTINYTEIMTKLQKQFNTYRTNTFNKLEEVVKNYNYGILQIFNEKRDYKEGKFFEFSNKKEEAKLFGRSNNFEATINTAYNTLIEKILADDLPIQKELDRIKNISADLKRNFKGKLKEYLARTIFNDFNSKLSNINSEMSKNQIDLIQYISKINYVMTERDGKVSKEGVPTIYKITGETTMVDKFKDDYTNIASGMTAFIEDMTKDKTLTKDKDYDGPDKFEILIKNNTKEKIAGSKDSVSFNDNNEKNFYLFFSQTVLDPNKLNQLIEFLTKLPEGVVPGQIPPDRQLSYNTYKDMVKNCFDARVKLYKQEQDAAMKLFEDTKTKYTTDSKYYDETTERKFDYVVLDQPSTNDKERILGILLYTQNVNNDKKTFNGKKKLT